MTTTETQIRLCRRCHGSGHDPEGPTYDSRQNVVLDRLGELGAKRAPLVKHRAYMRTDGRAELNRIYASARKLIARGKELGIRKLDMQDALGVTGAALSKIESGQTGA